MARNNVDAELVRLLRIAHQRVIDACKNGRPPPGFEALTRPTMLEVVAVMTRQLVAACNKSDRGGTSEP